MIQVVTYATHSQGMFEDLMNNSQDVEIKVLGWGKKWTGYNDKLKECYNYINELPDDDIIVIIDGFDSKIIKPLDEIEKRFLEMNCKVLFSIDPELSGKNNTLKVFTSCKNNKIINAGLYMGYVKYLKPILNDALEMKCKDDQRNINILCKKYPYLTIDENEIIFSNKKNLNACILGFPGETSMSRHIRGFKEYSQFFIFEYLILMFIILSLYPNKYMFIFTFMILFIFVKFSDKSCI